MNKATSLVGIAWSWLTAGSAQGQVNTEQNKIKRRRILQEFLRRFMIDFNLHTEALIGGQSTTLNALADKPHVRRGSRLNDFICYFDVKMNLRKLEEQ